MMHNSDSKYMVSKADNSQSIHGSIYDSHTSQDSISSTPDLFEPLERALTQTDLSLKRDLKIPANRVRINHTTRIGTSLCTTYSRSSEYEIDFIENDPLDPKNWPLWYRCMTIGFMSFATWTVVVYSTSYTSGMHGMMADFEISNEIIATIGVTSYLLGLACGSLLLAPISEIWGRRPVYLISMMMFGLLIIPCGVAKNIQTIIVCRFFGALAGAAMTTNAPGTLSDISDSEHRALAFSIWAIGPLNGPLTGPVIGGFVNQYLSWRWANWIVLILACMSWFMSASIAETYAPAILKQRAKAMRKSTGDERYWCRYEEGKGIMNILKTNFSRPFILMATEPILWFWDLYISLIYGILYLSFVAYPLIFRDIRGWSPGISGLSFLGIGVGACLAIAFEPLIRRMIKSHAKDPETGRVPPEASLSVICIAATMVPIGQLTFSWTSLPVSIHWSVSILAGIPFGAGNTIIFIYASAYIAGSYGIYAASALAGNAVVRSLFGGTLPLVGIKLYKALSPQWAGTLLGLLEVCCIPIPIIFYKWGHRIRRKSRMIKRMREDEERRDMRKDKARLNRGDMEVEDLEIYN